MSDSKLDPRGLSDKEMGLIWFFEKVAFSAAQLKELSLETSQQIAEYMKSIVYDLYRSIITSSLEKLAED